MTVPGLSVIVPAHQEERTIGRCLAALAGLAESGEAVVVVVVNGSTDRTAEIARAHTGVTVLVVDEAGKAAALNAGDETTDVFPRIYLDADVVVSAAGLRALAAALPADVPRVGNLRLSVDVSGSSWPVRSFYDVFLRLPYARTGLIGLGMYGVSESGRQRFERFPPYTADDLFVQRLFDHDERVLLDGAAFTVYAPRTAAALLAVRTRVHYGNLELAAGNRGDQRFSGQGASSAGGLVRLLLARPGLIPSAVVYACLTTLARRRAARRLRSGLSTWDRDDSSR